MGCEYGKPPVVAPPAQEPAAEVEVTVTGFTDTQIDTIRSTWPLLCDHSVRVGVEVFVRIFREAPSIHALFQHFSTHNVEELHGSAVFQDHAGRFMAIIQSLVEHLESPQDVDQTLFILGAKHAAFRGYHPEYFRFYTKCMTDVWEAELGEEFIHEVRDSWRLAFDYIVDRMTEGFHLCLSGRIQEVLDASSLLPLPPVPASSLLPLPPAAASSSSSSSVSQPLPARSVKGREGSGGQSGRVAELDDGLVKVQ